MATKLYGKAGLASLGGAQPEPWARDTYSLTSVISHCDSRSGRGGKLDRTYACWHAGLRRRTQWPEREARGSIRQGWASLSNEPVDNERPKSCRGQKSRFCRPTTIVKTNSEFESWWVWTKVARTNWSKLYLKILKMGQAPYLLNQNIDSSCEFMPLQPLSYGHRSELNIIYNINHIIL